MGKRDYGTGTITQRGDAWWLRYRVNGKRFAKTVRGTKADAVKELRRCLSSADTGEHVAPSKLTFAKWVAQWLSLKEGIIAGQTWDRYYDALYTHAVPMLGPKLLQKITALDIDKLYKGVRLAKGSMTQLNFVVKTCFQAAVRKKLIASNPVNDTERLPRNDEEVGVVLDEAPLAALVAGFKGSSLYGIVATAAYTGMRKGEVLALRWEDVDLDAETISISRNVQETKIRPVPKTGPKVLLSIKKPKTKRGIRIIQIDDGLVGVLRQERERHLRLVAGVPDGVDVDLSLIRLPKDALCFPAMGTMYVTGKFGRTANLDLTMLRNPHSVYDMFAKRARKLGFELRFHDLRGTHSTILLDKGVPVHVVAKRIGDTPETLLRHYAKRTKKSDASAAAVIGTLTSGVL